MKKAIWYSAKLSLICTTRSWTEAIHETVLFFSNCNQTRPFQTLLLILNKWRSKGEAQGAVGPGRHFADQKYIFEKGLKVLAFRYYYLMNIWKI